MTPEQLAIFFHETYERLAPSYGYETRKDTRAFDSESANGRLMIAVCGEVLPLFSDEIEQLRNEDEVHWKTRRTLLRKIERLHAALAFARSVIKSGEGWTTACEEMLQVEMRS